MSSRFTHLARGRTAKRGTMNKTEAAYARILDREIEEGKTLRYWFEPMSFRLSSPPGGQPARYTPDFMLLRPTGEVWIVDVKSGSGFDDNAAIVRIKCCAEQYPLFRFFLAKKLETGAFELTEV